MAKTVALTGPTLAWAREVFRDYYERSLVPAPPRVARREFAAFPFTESPGMRRHTSFPTEEELRTAIRRETPRHLYYSAAYYRRPDEIRMDAKEWLGADLIFDLDADHLRGAELLDYPTQLQRVKERVLSLLDDFLFGDFGIDPRETLIVFSGGRGYHVHVRDERFLGLTTPERRELVDYILGVGFDPSATVIETRGSRIESDDRNPTSDGQLPRSSRPVRRGFRHLAPSGAPGWTGRTTREMIRMLSRWEASDPTSVRAELEAAGLPHRRAVSYARQLTTERKAQRIREQFSFDVFAGAPPTDLIDLLLRRAASAGQSEIDAPVTTDVHRLIRLPGSLHGGTGFRVVPLSREDLTSFDPFSAATMSDGPGVVPVRTVERVGYPFPDGGVALEAGVETELPTPQALFLVLRGEAELRPSPAP